MKHSTDISHIFTVIGLALLGYGLFLFKPWVGLAVCGALMFSYGVMIDVFKVVTQREKAE